jgi:hypothetical protein
MTPVQNSIIAQWIASASQAVGRFASALFQQVLIYAVARWHVVGVAVLIIALVATGNTIPNGVLGYTSIAILAGLVGTKQQIAQTHAQQMEMHDEHVYRFGLMRHALSRLSKKVDEVGMKAMGAKILSPAPRFSEFYTRADGTHFNGTCTQTALVVAMAAVRGTPCTDIEAAEWMINTTLWMIGQGTCESNGAATIAAVANEARRQGYQVAIEWDYQEPLTQNWQQCLDDNAGDNPIVLQLANGKALRDAETGAAPEDATLQYHAICIVGVQNNGYICVDGDNPQVTDRYQIYSQANLDAAVPCGLLVLKQWNEVSPVATPAPALPTGWVPNPDGSITASNGILIVRGFAKKLIDDPLLAGYLGAPLAAEQQVQDVGHDGQHGPGVEQMFQCGWMGYTQKDDVFVLWTGEMLQKAYSEISALQGQIALLQQQVQQQQIDANLLANVHAFRDAWKAIEAA